jgi:hypothetical protein
MFILVEILTNNIIRCRYQDVSFVSVLTKYGLLLCALETALFQPDGIGYSSDLVFTAPFRLEVDMF